MKFKHLPVFLLVVVLVITACSKKESNISNNGLSNTPTAKAAYDNNSFGIYKGVFVGSSGTVIINVKNENSLTATLKIDGTTYDFTSTQTIQQNQPVSVKFVSGVNSFTFTSAADGSNPVVTNIIIAGHPNAVISVIKETSTAIVKVYEGTYKEIGTGGEQGTFNWEISNGQLKGVGGDNAGQFTYLFTGTVSNNQINASVAQPFTTISGTISDDNASGTFSANASGGVGGTWTAQRKL